MSCNLPIVIVGTGGAARSFVHSLQLRNIPILGIVSRGGETALEYLCEVGVKQLSFNVLIDEPCICILAVPDKVISETASKMQLAPESILVHCAGSVDMQELSSFGNNYGVIYPLQTMHPLKVIDFKHVVICVEASNQRAGQQINSLASQLSDKVHEITSRQRLLLHLAAIFACNFSNYMYSISEQLLKNNHQDFSLLHSLIMETAEKATQVSPSQSQTGPAVRNDLQTIEKHLKILNGQELEIYQFLTRIIREKHGKV
jgi:predicted short-subunit dehydrogenase-like oxidoreductase (DUF2520 family)